MLRGDVELVKLLEPEVTAAGFALVRVRLMGGDRTILQVMAEDPATGQMTIDQCASLSRRLSVLLDTADPIPHAYSLEVSSPGIDRPLTRRQDFARWTGHLARLELTGTLDWEGSPRKRFQGVLDGLNGDTVELRLDGGGRAGLPLADIRSAKLVLTDALLAASPALDPEGADEIEDDVEDERAERAPADADRMN
jgi:ribosome maturation factor RimP